MHSVLLGLILAQLSATADVERAVTDGIRRGAFPGAVVVVGTRDTVLLARGYGHYTWSSRSATPSPDSTLYDVASLTKVVATTPAVMMLVERGQIRLDEPVSWYLPQFRGAGKEAVTVRHLLAHTSGLRAFLRLDTLARDPDSARDIVLSEPLRWKPGSRVEYSDLNAMILGWIVEAVSGLPLDRFVATQILAPLSADQARFNPPRGLRSRIAPTGLWRGHSIAGEVHDQNAARLGGVSGHAGLFATGSELGRYAQLWLTGGVTRNGDRMFRPETIELFSRFQNGRRALGWEARDTTTSDNAGRLMGPRAFGHTGFTGTSLWIDPDRGIYVVILTNRVYAPRTGRSISTLKQIRGRIADAAVTLGVETCGVLLAGADTRPSGPRAC